MSPEELIALLERRKAWLMKQREAAFNVGDITNCDVLDAQMASCTQSLAVLHASLDG